MTSPLGPRSNDASPFSSSARAGADTRVEQERKQRRISLDRPGYQASPSRLSRRAPYLRAPPAGRLSLSPGLPAPRRRYSGGGAARG